VLWGGGTGRSKAAVVMIGNLSRAMIMIMKMKNESDGWPGALGRGGKPVWHPGVGLRNSVTHGGVNAFLYQAPPSKCTHCWAPPTPVLD